MEEFNMRPERNQALGSAKLCRANGQVASSRYLRRHVPSALWLVVAASSYLVPASVRGQEQTARGWSYQVASGLNIAQNQFSNWAEGGTDAVAYSATLQTQFINNMEKYQFTAHTKFGFGQTKQQGEEIRKTTDDIRLDAALVRKFGLKVDPYISVSARTQFAKGYNYAVKPKVLRSDFVNPLYLTESIGFGFEPRSGVFWRLGAGLKATITTQTRFALIYTDDAKTPEEIEKWRLETGLESTLSGTFQINTNLSYESRLGVFASFDEPQSPDVNWENVFTVQVAKYINVNLDVVLVYNEDVSRRTQVKEVLSIGFVYKLQK
jgi:hypothetical protein